MRRRKKSFWTRDLSKLPVVQAASVFLIPGLGLYGLYGAFRQEIYIFGGGRYGRGMTYIGTEAVVLGMCMFVGLFALITTLLGLKFEKVVVWKTAASVSVFCFIAYLLTLLNALFEVV